MVNIVDKIESISFDIVRVRNTIKELRSNFSDIAEINEAHDAILHCERMLNRLKIALTQQDDKQTN